MEKFIKVERIKNYMQEFEISSVFYDKKWDKRIEYINQFGFLSIYSILIIGLLLFHETMVDIVFIILLSILVGLFTYLHTEIIKDRILIPMYKDMYENGYYVSGYILFDDYRIKVDEFLYYKNGVDRLIKEIIKEYKR